MSTGKKIGISLGVLVFILCLVICCWYVYILEFGAEKLTSTTVNAGILEKADGGTEYILTVDYKSNQNHNGLEMMDLKLSYFTDENLEHTYSSRYPICCKHTRRHYSMGWLWKLFGLFRKCCKWIPR